MNLKIKVAPNAKENKITEKDGVFKIHTTAPAKKGKANKTIIQMISEYFNVAKSQVSIVKGLKSKEKTVIVDN